MERLSARKVQGYVNNGRYDVAEPERLRGLLEIKGKNIDTALRHFEGEIVELDMEAPPSINIEIIRKSVSRVLRMPERSLWDG